VDSYFDLVKRQLPLQTMLLLRLIVINLPLVLPHRKSKAIIIAYRILFVKNVKPHTMATSQRKKLQIVLVLIIAIAGFFAYRYYEKTMDTATLTPAE
jgi:hypothetical protein